MNRLLRLLLWVLAGLGIMAVLFAVYLLAVYPAEYIRRVFTYFQSDINDYRIFPSSHRAIFRSFFLFPPADPAAEEALVRRFRTGPACRKAWSNS
jgi:hypothetical protein